MARMKDVAQRCGVVESTVSHVINGTRYVSPEVTARVREAMREMNYHGNAHARRLARGVSDFMGLIVSDIENPFFPGLIKAFETAALERGCEVLLGTTHYDPERTARVFHNMIKNQVAGVAVMTSGVTSEIANIPQAHGVPSVFLDGEDLTALRSRIRIDFDSGVGAAVTYLHGLGHRDFALIAGPQHLPSHAALRQAVVTALKRFGLTPLVIEGQNTVGSGAEAVPALLAMPKPPTAILCSNDLTALGAVRALHQAGVSVPGQMSVVGVDDIPFAELSEPGLSTIRIPRHDLGEMACDILHRAVRDKTPGELYRLETTWVARGTTAKAFNRLLGDRT